MQDAEEAAAATSPPSSPRRSDVTQPQTAADAGTVSLYSGYALTPGNSTVKNQRCHETPHRIHRTASRRARRVTGRFAPSSVLPFTYSTFPAYFPAYSVKTQASSSGCFSYISARSAQCTRCGVLLHPASAMYHIHIYHLFIIYFLLFLSLCFRLIPLSFHPDT